MRVAVRNVHSFDVRAVFRVHVDLRPQAPDAHTALAASASLGHIMVQRVVHRRILQVRKLLMYSWHNLLRDLILQSKELLLLAVDSQLVQWLLLVSTVVV